MEEHAKEILFQVLPNAENKTFAEIKKGVHWLFFFEEKLLDWSSKDSNLIQDHSYQMKVSSFITTLYSVAEHCEYGTIKDELICDRSHSKQ